MPETIENAKHAARQPVFVPGLLSLLLARALDEAARKTRSKATEPGPDKE